MAEEHDLLTRALRGELMRLPDLLQALERVGAEPTPESIDVLRRVATHPETVRLDPAAGLPHAQPPVELLRSVAVQVLGEWDAEAHRDVFRHVVERHPGHSAAFVAREHLGE